MSKVDGPAAIAARANRRSRNARSLFIRGPIMCALDGWGQLLVPGPEVAQDLVADPGGQPPPAGVVAEQRGDVGEGDQPGPGRHRAEQGQARGPEDVVGPRPPVRGEDPPEDPGEVVDHHVGVGAGAVALQHVQARRRGPVARVEQHDLARDVLGEAGEHVGDRVALGVDEDDAASLGGVGEDLAHDEGGLAGAGRPADPHVVPGVGDRQADRARRARVGGAERPDGGAGQRDGGRRRDGPRPGDGQARQRRVRRTAGRPPRARRPTAGRPGPAGGRRSRRRGGAAAGGPASSARSAAPSPTPGRGRGRAAGPAPGRRRTGPATARPRPGSRRPWWRRRSG